MNRRLVAIGAAATVFVGSLAASMQDDRRIYGAGTNSCGQWTEARKGDDWFTAGQWVLGFVSAANQYSKTPPGKSDSRSMASWVDDYCYTNPDHDLSDAAQGLVAFLLSQGR
jgi:hypothetical protein